jgi:hypothetical protein
VLLTRTGHIGLSLFRDTILSPLTSDFVNSFFSINVAEVTKLTERLNYGLHDRSVGVRFRSGEDVSLGSEIYPDPYVIGTVVLYARLETPEREADHSPPSTTD